MVLTLSNYDCELLIRKLCLALIQSFYFLPRPFILCHSSQFSSLVSLFVMISVHSHPTQNSKAGEEKIPKKEFGKTERIFYMVIGVCENFVTATMC